MKMMPGQRSLTTTPNRIVTTGIKGPLGVHRDPSDEGLYKENGATYM